MDKQHIINEIKRTAEKNNGIPFGIKRFYTETGIRESDWFGKYWARWSDALIEAGYEPNQWQIPYDDAWVIEKLICFIREIDRYPVKAELLLKANQDKSFPSEGAFKRRGKKAELAKKVIEFCKGKDGFDDIIEICRPIADSNQPDTSPSSEEPSLGYVYLMKSGKNYKIGRTDALGRREYELAIQLPEKIATVHAIKTDDPIGIEAYWHRRFQDKRKRGEWFELSPEDVKAFKRRKFM
jgi:Meiotically up-regulated gene 113